MSRLDLFADWQGWNLSGEDRHRFVCRADTLAVHEERRDFTGMEFGRRTTKTLCCRIYDKTVQAEYSGAGYWKDIWADRWSPDLPVMRVEFEFGRAGLRQFGIDGVQEAIEASGALWAYATGTWLTLRASGSDPTRSHWPITGGWETIGRASISSGSYGIERMYEGRRSGTLRRLMPGLVGYLSSFAAIVGAEDVDDTLGEVGQYLMAIERDTMHPFSDRVAAKVRELGWR